ncbi:hypothetical protein WDZ17_06450 [Pseudokineococcus basanitobsidens]|uniref:Uncharacterized protein n=1 Tax=Pseudokineococcus basanitobsidens TaxID=1926649 RepID=A0ABU8RIN7_9ACTN
MRGRLLGRRPEDVPDGRDIEVAVTADAVRDGNLDVVAEMEVVVMKVLRA